MQIPIHEVPQRPDPSVPAPPYRWRPKPVRASRLLILISVVWLGWLAHYLWGCAPPAEDERPPIHYRYRFDEPIWRTDHEPPRLVVTAACPTCHTAFKEKLSLEDFE